MTKAKAMPKVTKVTKVKMTNSEIAIEIRSLKRAVGNVEKQQSRIIETLLRYDGDRRSELTSFASKVMHQIGVIQGRINIDADGYTKQKVSK
jgi:hypothetical protein